MPEQSILAWGSDTEFLDTIRPVGSQYDGHLYTWPSGKEKKSWGFKFIEIHPPSPGVIWNRPDSVPCCITFSFYFEDLQACYPPSYSLLEVQAVNI